MKKYAISPPYDTPTHDTPTHTTHPPSTDIEAKNKVLRSVAPAYSSGRMVDMSDIATRWDTLIAELKQRDQVLDQQRDALAGGILQQINSLGQRGTAAGERWKDIKPVGMPSGDVALVTTAMQDMALRCVGGLEGGRGCLVKVVLCDRTGCICTMYMVSTQNTTKHTKHTKHTSPPFPLQNTHTHAVSLSCFMKQSASLLTVPPLAFPTLTSPPSHCFSQTYKQHNMHGRRILSLAVQCVTWVGHHGMLCGTSCGRWKSLWGNGWLINAPHKHQATQP